MNGGCRRDFLPEQRRVVVTYISTVVVFLLTFGVLVTFHEYGHFWAARRSGMRVLRFSIGFGKPIISWLDKHGTEFVITAIPLGGYVKLLDARDTDLDQFALDNDIPIDEVHDAEFTGKSVWSRIFVFAAGPLANLLLAILVYWGMFLGGERGIAPVIATVQEGSIAAEAGLEAGQEIVEIDGEVTPTWQALHLRLLGRLGDSGVLTIASKYPNEDLVYQTEIELQDWLRGEAEPNPVAGLGISLFRPAISLRMAAITPNSAASEAGLLVGDELLIADGQKIESWAYWVEYIHSRPEQAIELVYERDGQQINTVLTPSAVQNDEGERIGFAGHSPLQEPWPEDMRREFFYSPIEALQAGVNKTAELSAFTLAAVKKIIVGQMSAKNMAGPITIAQVANDSAKSGLMTYLGLLAMLSISLGIFNLLPIPMLDGGHLMYFLIEIIKGSPVSERAQMIGHQFGFFFLAGVFVLVMVNDIGRL